jgi:two-component system sensor kinase FixL
VIGQHKDKSTFHLCLSVNKGAMNGRAIFVAIMNDLTDHKLDVTARRHAHRLQALLDGVSDAIVTVDMNGHVESFSATASALFGYSAHEVVGHPVTMLLPSPYSEEHGQHLLRLHNGENSDLKNIGHVVIGRKRDGSAFAMEIAIGETTDGDKPVLIGFIRDITGRPGTAQRLEQMQGELLRVSRLDAMGQMTLAIAHELNQPLAAICNYVNAIKRSLGAKKLTPDKIHAAQDLIEKASAQSLRAAAIVKGLRGFVEKRDWSREPADLGQIVGEALALAFVSPASSEVRVTLNLDRTLPLVSVDRVQIQQLLFNLIRNSLEAMQSVPTRELSLATRRVSGNFAEVTVQDSGPGLDEAIAKDLFKPFITSKPDGMGVGLLVCQAIVEAHGGLIELVRSDAGGTIFRVRLPLPPESPK